MSRHKHQISKKYEPSEQVQVCRVNKLSGAIRAALGMYTPAVVRYSNGRVVTI
jgi:hypothetical protein